MPTSTTLSLLVQGESAQCKSFLYTRKSHLLEELRIARGDGSHKRRLIVLVNSTFCYLMTGHCNRWENSGATIYWNF